MALTWRNVDAPQISTRDLAVAGHGLTNAFDRLGSTLAQREATLRQRATDSAIAQRLAIQDPEALGTIDLTGLDPRANLREVVTADNAHRSDVIRRADQNEDLLNKRAMGMFGQEHYDLAVAAYNGDEEAIARARQLHEANPMFGRYMAQVSDDLMGYRDTGVGRRETQRSNEATEGINRQNANTNAGHLSLARDRFAAEEERIRQAEQRRIRAIEDDQFGKTFTESFTENLDPTMTTEDALRMLRRTEAFKGLTPERQKAVRDYMTDGFYGRDALLTPTELEMREMGDYTSMLSRQQAALEASQQAAQSNFDSKHRPSQAIARAGEYADVTPEQVWAKAKERDISSEDIERMRAANPNIEYSHIMSALSSDGSIKDAPYWSWRSLFNPQTGSFSDYWSGGERALSARLAEMNERLSRAGDSVAYQQGRAEAGAPEQELMGEINRLTRQLVQSRAAGRPTEAIEAEIRKMQSQVDRLDEWKARRAGQGG